jgi:ABC-type Fe3+-hydroxamate transport system substrate-binding protein
MTIKFKKLVIFFYIFFILCCQNVSEKRSQTTIKLASLAPSVSDCLLFLDPQKKNFAICTNYDTAKAFSSLEKVNIYPWDAEKIMLLKPDCVILLKNFNSPSVIQFLEKQKIGYYMQDADNPEKLFSSLKDIALMLNDSSMALKKIKFLEQEFQNLKNSIKAKGIMAFISTKPIFIHGYNSFFDHMVMHLTGERLLSPNNLNSYPQLSPESILEMNPSILIFPNQHTVDNLFSSIPILKKVSAYKNQKLVIFDENCMARPSPNCVECLKKLKKILEVL